MNLKFLVRGTNDIVSATIHLLFKKGVLVRRLDDLSLLPQTLLEGNFIPVSALTVDAKHQEPEGQKGLLSSSVGLGPNFIVGETVGGEALGQIIAEIDVFPLQALLTGVLRGITHTPVPALIKTKIIEVDLRDQDAQVGGIPERPTRIAQGALKSVLDW